MLTFLGRALAPGMNFTGIDVAAKTVAYWTADDSHTLSWSTLPYAAQGIVQALKHPSRPGVTVLSIPYGDACFAGGR